MYRREALRWLCGSQTSSAFKDGLMHGETIYFDLATLCEQAGVPLESIRAAAAAKRISAT